MDLGIFGIPPVLRPSNISTLQRSNKTTIDFHSSPNLPTQTLPLVHFPLSSEPKESPKTKGEKKIPSTPLPQRPPRPSSTSRSSTRSQVLLLGSRALLTPHPSSSGSLRRRRRNSRLFRRGSSSRPSRSLLHNGCRRRRLVLGSGRRFHYRCACTACASSCRSGASSANGAFAVRLLLLCATRGSGTGTAGYSRRGRSRRTEEFGCFLFACGFDGGFG